MKKFISLILAILLAFGAVACSGGGAEDVTTVADDTTEAPKTETEAATDPVPETTEEIQEDKMLNILFLVLLDFLGFFQFVLHSLMSLDIEFAEVLSLVQVAIGQDASGYQD